MSIKDTYIAPLKAYDQTWDYYQRVIGDNGTLIDAEAVNRIYHSLNLLNLEDRSYKLYHAGAGLQKTSDQIDKLYDLGEDDVDQTFNGSDRPEHVQAWSNSEGVGNWQINVEKEATNYCKQSNDLGAISGGNWAKTEGAGDSPFGDSNEAVEVAMNTNSTGVSNYIELDVDTATNFSSGDYITVSFYAKKIAGSSGQPELLIEGEDGNSNPISLIQETFSTQIGEYQFFEFTAQFSADGTLRQAGCRIQDNDTSADTLYQVWGMQIERGQYPTSRIHTDGAIATRLRTIPTLTDVVPDTQGTGKGIVFGWLDFVMSSNKSLERGMIYTAKGSLDLYQPDSTSVLRAKFVTIEKRFPVNLTLDQVETIFHLFQYNNGINEVFLGFENGNLYKKGSFSYDSSNTLIDDIILSQRFSIEPTRSVHYFFETVQDFYSEEQVINVFTKTGEALFGNFQFNSFTDET